MAKIVIIGGGWSGIAAAVRARKQGADVTVAEKTDLLLGLGNVGGIMRNNGRYTAAEENIALGAGELFEITDKLSLHKDVDFPGHDHASFYDVLMVETEVRRLLKKLGIEIRLKTRITDVETDGDVITGVVSGDGEKIRADVFIETTGSTGPMGNCMRHGNGCSMCILRCPAFGPRVSITERAGLDERSKNGAFPENFRKNWIKTVLLWYRCLNGSSTEKNFPERYASNMRWILLQKILS